MTEQLDPTTFTDELRESLDRVGFHTDDAGICANKLVDVVRRAQDGEATRQEILDVISATPKRLRNAAGAIDREAETLREALNSIVQEET